MQFAQLRSLLNHTTNSSSITEAAADGTGCNCVPSDAAIVGGDYADFITYLDRYVSGPNGRFTQYIVWNEAVSTVSRCVRCSVQWRADCICTASVQE